MIYPEVSTENWLKKYTELEIEEGFCNHCGKSMKTTKPFIEKDVAGLVSPNCSCGKNTNQAMTMIPTSDSEIQYWNQLLIQ